MMSLDSGKGRTLNISSGCVIKKQKLIITDVFTASVETRHAQVDKDISVNSTQFPTLLSKNKRKGENVMLT